MNERSVLKQFVQYIMPELKKNTWYVDTRAVVEIVREEVCIESGTH